MGETPTRMVFNCRVASGMGMYSELQFPTRHEFNGLSQKWPEKMFPGSLNASIKTDGFPKNLDVLGNGRGVQKLDNKLLSPEFSIPHDRIGNNLLTPSPDMQERGTAQVWECEIEVKETAKKFNAWAVRRIGSAYADVIEIMSDKALRKTYGLEDGAEITVSLLAKGRDKTEKLAKEQTETKPPRTNRVQQFLNTFLKR